MRLNADFLNEAFGQVASWVYDETGIEIPVGQLRFEVLQNPPAQGSGAAGKWLSGAALPC